MWLLKKILEYFAVACLVFSISISMMAVVARYFWGLSFGAVEELSVYLIIYGVFAYVGPLIIEGEHIKMDALTSKLKERNVHLNDLLISTIGVLSYAFLFWTGLKWVNSLLQMKLMTASGIFFMFVPTLAIPIGMFIGILYSIQQWIIDLKKVLSFSKSEQERGDVIC